MGRDFAVAELRGPPDQDGRCGGRVNGAATSQSRNSAPTRDGHRKSWLQWGRDFAVAELTHPGRLTPAAKGFNGAATSQSRNSLRHSWSIDRARGSARVAVRGARPRRVSATVRNISRKPYRPLRWPTSAMASRGRPHASTADHTGTEAQHSRLAAALEGREAPRSGSPSRGRTWHGRTIPETDA